MISTKLFFLNFWVFKDDKSCHALFLIITYSNMILFYLYETWSYMQIKLKIVFLKEIIFFFLWKELDLFNTEKASHV
jgi:hypothetical protein